MAEGAASKRAAKLEKRKGVAAVPTYLFFFSSKSSMYMALLCVVVAVLGVAYVGVQTSMQQGERQFERFKTNTAMQVIESTPRPQPLERMADPEDEVAAGSRETLAQMRENAEVPTIADRDDLTALDAEQMGEMFFASDSPYPGQLKPILFAESRPTFSYGRGNWLMHLACYLPRYGYLPIFDSFVGGDDVQPELVADHSHHVPADYQCAEATKEVLAEGRKVFQDVLSNSNYRRLPMPVIAPSWSTNSEAWSATHNMVFTVFESPLMSREQFRRLLRYDTIFTASSYNAENLRAYGFPNVVTIRQGTSPVMFPERDPAVAQGDGVFTIFSGGKFEYRKGQDIVVEAVKRFAERHPDVPVRLVATWVNHWPRTARSMQCSKITDAFPVLGDDTGGGIGYPSTMQDKLAEAVEKEKEAEAAAAIGEDEEDEEEIVRGRSDSKVLQEREANLGEKLWDFKPWLVHNGLPENMFLSSPILLNKEQLRRVLTTSDVALFPNRAEAGTNMVASEALMSGLPVIITNTTGHQDLLRPKHPSGRPWAIPLNELQDATCNPSAERSYIIDVNEKMWKEPLVEDILLKLEEAFQDPEGAAGIGSRAAEVMRTHDAANKRVMEFAAVLNHLLDSSKWGTKGGSASNGLAKGFMESLERAKAAKK